MSENRHVLAVVEAGLSLGGTASGVALGTGETTTGAALGTCGTTAGSVVGTGDPKLNDILPTLKLNVEDGFGCLASAILLAAVIY